MNQEHIAKIDLLNATVTDRENIISGYEAECKIHISNIEDLNKTLAQKGNEIRDNREMIDSQKTKIGELEVEL